jgi:hypothetical protein
MISTRNVVAWTEVVASLRPSFDVRRGRGRKEGRGDAS